MRLLDEESWVRDTYEVESFLGEGAFAEVYRVKHRILGRQAMKVFKTVDIEEAEADRLFAEAILLSRIGHPNIVRVYDAGLLDTRYGRCAYITMEFVAGGTLEEFWKSHGARFVEVETAVDLLRQVCRGLAVAHGSAPPIVHRDLKPQNILVGYEADGLRARISDFGLAKHVNPLTLLVSAQGTRRFKAPEVFRDPSTDSRAGDIWALGCTLYLLLTDRLPYAGVEDWELESFDFGSKPLVPPSHLNYRVDTGLDRIVTKALAVDPSDRHQDAKELSEALNAWKPRAKRDSSRPGDSTFGKSALGSRTPPDEPKAVELAERALRISRVPGSLNEAADLMEEAMKKSPTLRGKYDYLIQLWRRGIVM